MENITFHRAQEPEFPKISQQIAESYVSAYQGLMDPAYLRSIPDDFWVPILHEGKAKGDVCLVAACAGHIVGSAVFGKSLREDYPEDAMLHAIYLLPQYTGQKLGRRLYHEVEKYLWNEGFTACILEVLSTNRRAIGFYESLCYARTDSFWVHEHGMRLPCVTMRKKLAVPGAGNPGNNRYLSRG